MKKYLAVESFFFSLLVALFVPMNAQSEIIYGSCGDIIEVLDTFSVPFDVNFPTNSVHGLAFDGQSLWAANHGGGNVYKLGFGSDGDMICLDEIDATGDTPTGITFVGKTLYVAGGLEIVGLKTTGKKTGKVLRSFPRPGEDSTGLTFDGHYLWNAGFNLSDPATTGFIFKLKRNGDLVTTFDSPGKCPEGLAFDGDYLWHVELCDEELYKLTIDGTVVCKWKWYGLPIGLTFDGTYLWLSDADTQEIFKIDIGK